MTWRQLRRGVRHLRQGTLQAALRRRIDNNRSDARRTWWLAQRAMADSMVVTIRPGVQMKLYFDDELSWLIYAQNFEWQERLFVERVLRPGDVFVDVGANIGLFTLLAARCVGQTGHVYSFEPCPETFDRLHANVALNRAANVTTAQLALSDEAGDAVLTIREEGRAAWNSLAPPEPGQDVKTASIRCEAWDHYADAHGLTGKVTMMKVDVEGWEARVLRGGARTLARPDAPIMLVEFADEICKAAGTSCTALYRTLEAFGYCLYTYNDLDGLQPDPPRDGDRCVNLIATKHREDLATRLAF